MQSAFVFTSPSRSVFQAEAVYVTITISTPISEREHGRKNETEGTFV